MGIFTISIIDSIATQRIPIHILERSDPIPLPYPTLLFKYLKNVSLSSW